MTSKGDDMSEVTKIEPHHPLAASDPMVSMIERVVMNPDLPIDRITAMIDIRERQLAKEAEQAFNAAFAAAMAEMPDVPRSGENKHLKRRYSTLDDLIRTSRPVLARHGLSMNWITGIDGDSIRVTAVVRHAAGHSIDTTQHGPRDKSGSMNVLQGGGSTETYLKRFTGFAILGLSSGDERDDDGQTGAQGEPMAIDDFLALRDRIDALEDGDKVEAYLCQSAKVSALDNLTKRQCAEAMALIDRREAKKNGGAA